MLLALISFVDLDSVYKIKWALLFLIMSFFLLFLLCKPFHGLGSLDGELDALQLLSPSYQVDGS